jgi:hypothetical protein
LDLINKSVAKGIKMNFEPHVRVWTMFCTRHTNQWHLLSFLRINFVRAIRIIFEISATHSIFYIFEVNGWPILIHAMVTGFKMKFEFQEQISKTRIFCFFCVFWFKCIFIVDKHQAHILDLKSKFCKVWIIDFFWIFCCKYRYGFFQ